MDAMIRDDAALWKTAFEEEMLAIRNTGYFTSRLTMDRLRSSEYTQITMPQRVFYSARYGPDDRFIKAKCRIRIQGHPGHLMRYGRSVNQTMAVNESTGSQVERKGLYVKYEMIDDNEQSSDSNPDDYDSGPTDEETSPATFQQMGDDPSDFGSGSNSDCRSSGGKNDLHLGDAANGAGARTPFS